MSKKKRKGHSSVRPTPAADPDSRFFHRKHFVQAFWGLVIAAVAGIAGIAWQRGQAPQEVVVVNSDTTARVVVAADSIQRALMTELLREVQAQRKAPSVVRIPTPVIVGTSSIPANSDISPLKLPLFKLPPEAKGARLESLDVFATSACPSEEQKAGGELALTMNLRVQGDTARLSPIHVTITRRSTPSSGGMQLFSQQYELRVSSIVVVPVPPQPGRLELAFGVYSLAELNTTYPPFYRRECPLRIVD